MSKVAFSGMWRLVARPAALGSAAVLLASGALAATRSVETAAGAGVSAPAASASVDTRAAVGVAVTGELPEVAAPAAKQRPAGEPARPAKPAPAKDRPDWDADKRRHGSHGEYGYISKHSSYVQRDGLRLELDTHSNEATSGQPHRVTIALTNVSDRPIALYGPKDCHLVVGAARAAQRGEEKDDHDQVWACASDGRDPRTQDEDATDDAADDSAGDRSKAAQLVIRPGQRISHDVGVTFTRPGDWAVWGMCACYEMKQRPPSDREPGVLDRVFASDPPQDRSSASDRHAYPHRGHGLVTPPIRMAVS